MAIEQYRSGGGLGSGGLMSSRAAKLGLGYLTGGLGGAALGLASSGNPNIGTVSSLASAIDRRKDSMSDDLNKEDPLKVLDDGLAALDHPDVPQEVRDVAIRPLLAAKTHGQNGLPVDHLFPSEET